MGIIPLMEQAWKNRVRQALEKSGLTMKAASKKAGQGETFVRDMLERDRVPSIDKFSALAEALGTSAAELLEGGTPAQRSIPLVGHVGDGQALHAAIDEAPFGFVEAPPGVSADTTVAVEVRGNSMYPLLDRGDLIYYEKRGAAPELLVGKLCVVKLTDGRIFVKRLRRGSARGLYTLESLNGPPVEDVTVDWAARIDWMRPRET
ncbi:MAG: helix-turn-helix domain-containing protein [Hyphomicrobiales bacterium]|nr:helix-turn-helix domain-containing protein [Hyphomicrobiales bacterium]